MILFPVGGEQEYNSKLIEYLQCGKLMKEINETKIGEAVDEILNNKQYSENAKKFSKTMENIDGTERAIKIIIERQKTYS